MNQETKSSDKESKLALKLVAFVGTIILLSLWVSHMATGENATKYNGLGEIGDTIGGLTAPIIGLLAAYLVYISFEEQRKANISNIDLLKLQREQFEEEKKLNQKNDWYAKHHVLLDEIKMHYKSIEFVMGTEITYGSNAFHRASFQTSQLIDETFHNSVIYLLWIIEDLTERVNLETEYKEEAELINRKLNLLYTKIIMFDISRYQRHLVYLNNPHGRLGDKIADINTLQLSIFAKYEPII